MNKKILSFFLWTHGLTWAFWIPAVLIHAKADNSLVLLGGVMPLLVTIIFLFRHGTRADRKAYGQSLLRWKTLFPWWWILLLLAPLAIHFLSMILSAVFWNPPYPPCFNSLSFFYVVAILFYGPVPEEPAWRGWATQKLLPVTSFIRNSLIVGLPWALWHWPLFFFEGTLEQEQGFLTPSFWVFMTWLVVLSFFYTWIYVKTNYSVPAVLLFHFATNLADRWMFSSFEVRTFRLLLYILVLVAGWLLIRASGQPASKNPFSSIHGKKPGILAPNK